MSKIVMVYNFRLRNKEKQDEILNYFINRGYIIERYNYIDKNNVDVTILERDIEQLKNIKKNIEEIIVISNIKDLILEKEDFKNE